MLSIIVLVVFFAMTFGLIWYFVQSDRGSKEPTSALLGAFGFGFLGIVLAALAEAQLIPHAWIAQGGASSASLAGFLLVGIIEEACKFGPLAGHIYGRSYFNEVTDGILYFGISGLSFGLFENILYLLGNGGKVALLRVVILLFFHAASSGIIGYYLIRAKLAGVSRFRRPIVALVSLMLLHGFYDFAISSENGWLVLIGLAITIGMNIAMFFYWQRAKELDAAYGLSASGKNNYCPNCGKPNLGHDMYCIQCGART